MGRAALLSASSAALAAAIFTCPTGAQAQPVIITKPAGSNTPAPPNHTSTDANGVDLLTGEYTPPPQAISVGVAGSGGMTQYYLGKGLRDNLTGGILYFDNVFTVWLGEESDTFSATAAQLADHPYPTDDHTGSTLAFEQGAGVYTYTLRDGTKVLYKAQLFSGDDAQRASGLVTEVRRPSGEVWTYHYKTVGNYSRLEAVTNSFGYQIKYEYHTDEVINPEIKTIYAVNATVFPIAPLDPHPANVPAYWPRLAFSPRAASEQTVTDTAGRVTKTVTLANGGSETTYPGNRVVRVDRRTDKRVERVTTAAGTWGYQYDFSAAPYVTTTVTDQTQRTVSLGGELDDSFVRRTCDGLQHCTIFEPDGNGRVRFATSPEGVVTAYTYDDRGNLTAKRTQAKSGDPPIADIIETAHYPAACDATNEKFCNSPEWTQDALQHQTDYTYAPEHGGVTSLKHPARPDGVRPEERFSYVQKLAQDQSQSIWLLDSVSSCRTAADCTSPGSNRSDETKVTLGYGVRNLTPEVQTTADGTGVESAQVTATYDDIGNLTVANGPLPYDSQRQADDITQYRYDPLRRLIRIVDPDPDGVGQGQTDFMRARKMTYGDGGELILFQQGVATNIDDEAQWAATDYSAHTGFDSRADYATGYDLAGRKVLQTASQLGEAPASYVQYGYDGANRLQCTAVRMVATTFGSTPGACSQTFTAATRGSSDPDRITKYDYDLASRLTQVTEALDAPGQRAARRFTYSDDNLPLKELDARDNVTNYQYDRFDRLERIVYPDAATGQNGAARVYQRDANGQVTTETLRNGTGQIGTAFDAFGRPKTITSYAGPSIGGSTTAVLGDFTYDNQGRVLTATADGYGTVTNTYDSRGNLKTQTVPVLGAVSYDYDSADRRTRMTWPAAAGQPALFIDYIYDAAGKLIEMRENGATQPPLIAYRYNARDLRVGLTRSNGVVTGYTYGAAALQDTLSHNIPGGGGVTYTYGRNPAGQIVSKASTNADWDAVTADPAKTYDVNRLNQYTRAGDKTLASNVRGDMTQDGSAAGQPYSYDNLDRLLYAKGSTLTYDAYGRLAVVMRSDGTQTRFLYDGVDLIAEFDGAGNLMKRYLHGPGVDEPLVAYDPSGTKHFLMADQVGSVTGATSSAGAIESRARFDDYGQGSHVPQTRFGFTGQISLDEAGLYHFKARAYSPALGRFLQPDPIDVSGLEGAYTYASNDPINTQDPSGLDDSPAGPATGGVGTVVVKAPRPVVPSYDNKTNDLQTDGLGRGTAVNSEESVAEVVVVARKKVNSFLKRIGSLVRSFICRPASYEAAFETSGYVGAGFGFGGGVAYDPRTGGVFVRGGVVGGVGIGGGTGVFAGGSTETLSPGYGTNVDLRAGAGFNPVAFERRVNLASTRNGVPQPRSSTVTKGGLSRGYKFGGPELVAALEASAQGTRQITTIGAIC